MPNLRYQRELPDHNYFPSVTIAGAEGARKHLRVTMYQSEFGSSINQSHHLIFLGTSECNLGSFIVPIGP